MTTLARILDITPAAVCQWGETIPEPREWQLRVLRPEWFGQIPVMPSARRPAQEGSAA